MERLFHMNTYLSGAWRKNPYPFLRLLQITVVIVFTHVHRQSLGVTIYEPLHEISNNVVCATTKASDQPAHMRSLIRAFASRLNIL